MAGEEDKGNETAAALAKANEEAAEARRALAIERAARSEAERRGTASAAEAARLKDTLAATATNTVETELNSLKTKADTLKKDYAAALGEGDFDKAADIQLQMATVAAQMNNVEGAKHRIEHEKKNPPQNNGGVDKEGYIAKQTPRTAAWLRQHPEYFENPALQSKVTGAHHLAVGNGLQIDSDEYFSFIEKQTGMDTGAAQEQHDPPPHQQRPGPKPGPRTPAAPPTRDGAALQRPANLRPGERFIPAEMRAAAEMCGNTPEQYHDEYVRLVNAGQLTDKYGIVFKN